MENWYHGSSANFDSFQHQQYGTNGHAQGFGIYLTQSKEVAASYAGTGKDHDKKGFIYHVDLSKIKDMRQLDPDNVTMNSEDIVQVLKAITEVQDEYPYTLVDYSGNPDLEVGWNEENEEVAQEIAFNLLENETNDLDVINELRNASNESEAVGKGLSQAMIGSVPDWTQVDENGQPALVVFNPDNLSILEKESVGNNDQINPERYDQQQETITVSDILNTKAKSLSNLYQQLGSEVTDHQEISRIISANDLSEDLIDHQMKNSEDGQSMQDVYNQTVGLREAMSQQRDELEIDQLYKEQQFERAWYEYQTYFSEKYGDEKADNLLPDYYSSDWDKLISISPEKIDQFLKNTENNQSLLEVYTQAIDKSKALEQREELNTKQSYTNKDDFKKDAKDKTKLDMEQEDLDFAASQLENNINL